MPLLLKRRCRFGGDIRRPNQDKPRIDNDTSFDYNICVYHNRGTPTMLRTAYIRRAFGRFNGRQYAPGIEHRAIF